MPIPPRGHAMERGLDRFGDCAGVATRACFLPDPAVVRLEIWGTEPALQTVTLALTSCPFTRLAPACGPFLSTCIREAKPREWG